MESLLLIGSIEVTFHMGLQLGMVYKSLLLKSMNYIHSSSNFRPWAFFRILDIQDGCLFLSYRNKVKDAKSLQEVIIILGPLIPFHFDGFP